MKKESILKWIVFGVAIAINLFIIINSFINGEVSAKESNGVAEVTADVINTVKPETITPTNFEKFAYNLRKVIGHYLLCGFSGGFTTWSIYLFVKDKKCGYFLYQLAMTLGFGFLLAVVTEFAQSFVPGRSGNWKDVGIDFCGYFLGFSIVFLILLFRKSKIFNKKKYMKKQAK